MENGEEIDTIELNTLLMILVAITGFLGNMIHVATSFTTFIGSGEYKRNWATWYFVRPVTASALALALYFVLRGGFLNYSYDAANINLYGVLTLAVLSGLFTDLATQKLKEIFTVAFNPKDNRPDKLATSAKVTSITGPAAISKTAPNTILIKGANFDKDLPTIKINNESVTSMAIQPELITLTYTVPQTQQAATVFHLEVLNSKGESLFPPKDFS